MIFTKKRIIAITISSIVVVLIIAIIFGVSSTPNIMACRSNNLYENENDSEKFSEVKNDNVQIHNNNLTLILDASTSHFKVIDTANGTEYSSFSNTSEDEEKSEIIVKYYDSNSTLYSMNSFKNSVQNNSFQVLASDDAIRVIYKIRKTKKILFVPKVLSEKTFIKICNKLDSGQRRRLKFFYTYYQADNNDKTTKEMMSLYPVLKKQPLYIRNDSATESTLSEITNYMNSAEYTINEYSEELKNLDIKESADEDMPASFTVPVEYRLNEKGFTATILSESLNSDSTGYTLTDIDLLPYFASVDKHSDGWMLVPDGSGAIIDLSKKSNVSYTQHIYGNDFAIEKDRTSSVIQNAGLPVFAMNDGTKSFFAMISNGEEVSSVNAEVYGEKFPQSRIYTSFACKSVDVSNAGELRKQNALNLYQKDYVKEKLSVDYFLCSSSATYSEMANLCRDLLIEDGTLSNKNDIYMPLYLDFTGYETVDSSFMGISTNKKIVFSNLQGINTSINDLYSRGIKDLSVRLRAYSDGGIFQKVQNGLSIDSKIGSLKQLNELSKLLKSNNGLLYLENSISTVYDTGNGFKKMEHASRGLKKTVVKGIDYDLVTGIDAEANFKYYLTSPVYFESLTNNFIDSFNEKTGKTSDYGYSRSDYGSKLWSDFNENRQIDRCASSMLAGNAIKNAKKCFSSIMSDGSNLYALKDSNVILNMPLGSSNSNCESYQIPFYQMVIHGYKNYSGSAINISQNSRIAFLQSIESGANLYFSVYTNKDVSLKESKIGYFTYPTYFGDLTETIVDYNLQFRKLFDNLYNQTITSHLCVTDKLRITVYENGTEIAVNYDDEDTVYNGKTIPRYGYSLISKGGECS